jgi:hypothetical protein
MAKDAVTQLEETRQKLIKKLVEKKQAIEHQLEQLNKKER